jgi:hypothetical protein
LKESADGRGRSRGSCSAMSAWHWRMLVESRYPVQDARRRRLRVDALERRWSYGVWALLAFAFGHHNICLCPVLCASKNHNVALPNIHSFVFVLFFNVPCRGRPLSVCMFARRLRNLFEHHVTRRSHNESPVSSRPTRSCFLNTTLYGSFESVQSNASTLYLRRSVSVHDERTSRIECTKLR